MSEFTDLQTTRASDAYIRYCKGVWIIQNPDVSAELIGCRDLDTDEAKIEIVELGEDLMQNGSRDFLKTGFPQGVQSFEIARNMRDEVEANARLMLEEIVEKERARLDSMNPEFWRSRLAPFLSSVVMTRLMHGDYNKIATRAMMGDFAINPSLIEIITDDRTLGTRNIGRATLQASVS